MLKSTYTPQDWPASPSQEDPPAQRRDGTKAKRIRFRRVENDQNILIAQPAKILSAQPADLLITRPVNILITQRASQRLLRQRLWPTFCWFPIDKDAMYFAAGPEEMLSSVLPAPSKPCSPNPDEDSL